MSPGKVHEVVERAVAGAALASLSGPLIAIAAAVRLTSPGPALFRQTRIGQGGRRFTLYKFRSMANRCNGPEITKSGDPRVTPVGALLRKTKLDELPGLWNIVRGEMSFVGMRPEVPRYYDPSCPKWRAAVQCKPGITHPTTRLLRNEEDILAACDDPEKLYRERLLPLKLRMAADYDSVRTPTSDIQVILATVLSVFRHSEAPRSLVDLQRELLRRHSVQL